MDNLKIGVVVFHKDVWKIYQERWFRRSLDSMVNQNVKEVHFYEVNYGEDSTSFLSGYGVENLKFYHNPLSNYAEAMNFIISEAFSDGCDYVFNTNLDDFYREDRIEKQLELIQSGYDIVSSDFCYVEEKTDRHGSVVDQVVQYMHVWRTPEHIIGYFRNGENIFAHPAVCYSKKFWEGNKYDKDKVPQEDFHLWRESIEKGYKFAIHPEVLLCYRRHENQVSTK
jgi:hypothetical protein